ncbi:spermatogenesis-associated protein 2 [Tachysurus vachellii]|uniref:spermatogenesis-associated protein 2 n=1 Tax=Tachysurus vachellii TaxID=175792 RepID=UPI00296AEB23|nr:spermatogenesis-associated protein 2 [Tachysurus vachellii]
MDAKLRDDLFRRYVAFLEKRLEEGVGGAQGNVREEALVSTATALLGACEAEAGQRFRTIRFYDIVENSLRMLKGSNLHALESAFATLETVCTNLLLFPWKKEFRCIKMFTGPYVYQLQSAICDSDLRAILRSIGYSRDQDLQYVMRDQHTGSGAHHLRQLAFELLLAQAECRLLRERGGGVAELEAVEVRRNSGDDVARLSARQIDLDRAHLRRSGRPSKSVDVTDSAGHWHQANKPVLKTSLSLRKEPLFVDAEEDLKDEIIRPVGDYYPSQPSEPYSYHLSSLDEIDLYTERGMSGRHTPSRTPSRESWESWAPKSHGLKCQGCGLSSLTLSSCQRCDAILCPTCHGSDPAPCCGFPDFPKNSSRPLDGYLPVKEKLSVYSSSHPHAHAHTHTHTHPLSHSHSHSPHLDKPVIGAKLFQSKPPSTSGASAASAPGVSRCGFCNKTGASHTCVNCSKVSCDTCTGLYMGDVCTRKSLHHNFVPNHQLNYKSSTISHLVYR